MSTAQEAYERILPNFNLAPVKHIAIFPLLSRFSW